MPYQTYTRLAPSDEDNGNTRSLSWEHTTNPRTQLWTFLAIFPWVLAIIFGTSTGFLLITARHDYQFNGDIAGIAPLFTQKIVTFQPNRAFVANLTSSSFKSDTRNLWLDLVPKGLGFLHIEHPERHAQLPPPYHKDNKTVYTTSMTHQLHCLYMIMGSYNDLAVDGYKAPPEGAEDPHWHIAHCFDYIRQGIMCAGDTALEGEQTTFPSGIKGTDGWNVKHVCKNYVEVYDWLEMMAVTNRTWI